MFDEDDEGSLFFEASTSDDKYVEISVQRTNQGDWLARVSFSDAKMVKFTEPNREVAAASAINRLSEMLDTEHNRLNLLYPYRDLDDDWPMLQAMSHGDIERALAVSEPEAARRVSLSPQGLRRMRERGEGPPAVWVSERRLAYRVKDLEAWLETRPTAL